MLYLARRRAQCFLSDILVSVGTYSWYLTQDMHPIAKCSNSIQHRWRSRCIRRTSSLHRRSPGLSSAPGCCWSSASGCCRFPTKTRHSSTQIRSCSRSTYDRSQLTHQDVSGKPVNQRRDPRSKQGQPTCKKKYFFSNRKEYKCYVSGKVNLFLFTCK